MGRGVRVGGYMTYPTTHSMLSKGILLMVKFQKMNSFYVLRFLNFGFENEGGRSEQHVCKGILVISLSLSQAEQ